MMPRCDAPIQLPGGVWSKCGVCWKCRDSRVNDFIGRCIAEQMHSDEALSVTLTYRGDVVEATSLYYRDIQLMLKRLRVDGFKVRYLCAGEHGELKGRAHWHVILFLRGKTLDLPLERRFEWNYWPHGFAYMQRAEYKGFKYVCKYLLKNDEVRGYRKVLRLSKYPPLGVGYFYELAERMAEQQLALHSAEYSFSHVLARAPQGYKPRVFWLTNRAFELFCERYVEAYSRQWGKLPPHTDFLWSAYYDAIAARERELAFEPVNREPVRWSEAVPSFPVQQAFLLLPRGGLVSRYSDGSAVVIWEGHRWRVDATGRTKLDPQLRGVGVSPGLWGPIASWLAFPGSTSDRSGKRSEKVSA